MYIYYPVRACAARVKQSFCPSVVVVVVVVVVNTKMARSAEIGVWANFFTIKLSNEAKKCFTSLQIVDTQQDR